MIATRRYNPTTPPTETPAPAPPELRVLPAPTAAAAEVSAPASGLKKLNLAGIAKKKETGKDEYPVFVDAKASEIAAQIKEEAEEFEALKGSLESNKKFLIELVLPFHFGNCAGKIEPPKAVIIDSPRGRVRVDMKNSYPSLPDENALLPILGGQTSVLFRQSFELTIDGDKIPEAAAGTLVCALQELFARHGASDALTARECIKPVPDFHVKRHLLFDAARNLQIQAVCPIRAAVAVKNVK